MKKSLLFLLVIFLIISCQKDIRKGSRIAVSGFAVDTVKNKNLPSAKVYLVGCKNSFSGGTYCADYLDSAITDENGNFSISYKAEGNSVDYVLEVARDNKYGDMLFQQFPFTNNSTNVRVKSQELNTLQLQVRVDFNPYDTFYIYPTHGLYTRLIGRHLDTTVFLKVLPNNDNKIDYRVISIGNDSGAIYRKVSDILSINLADTTKSVKMIANTYDMDLE